MKARDGIGQNVVRALKTKGDQRVRKIQLTFKCYLG